VRAGKTISFQVKSEPAKAELVFRRDRPAGWIEVRAVGNRIEVRASGVAKYTLLFNREQFDFSQPLVVFTNGQRSFQGRIEPDPRLMLQQAALDNDRTAVYAGNLQINVPADAR
jgi:hypothetical protein